jgi:hypothetical protein
MELENPIVDILTSAETPPNWLIPDLFLQGAMPIMAGEPGAGKSYVSYTFAMSIATGCPALGGLIPARPPKRVIYFDEENSEQDRNKYLRRIYNGLAIQNSVAPDLGLLQENFWPMHMHLGVPDWYDRAEEIIKTVMEIAGPVDAIMFDTATPAFDITDENDNGEATKAIKMVRNLMKLGDPMITALILKHAKMRTEGGRRMIRGAKAWQGSADGVMFQVKATGRPRRDGLALTRLEPDKTRAFGLTSTIYITPQWGDNTRNALLLWGSYSADKEHKNAEDEEEEDDTPRRKKMR